MQRLTGARRALDVELVARGPIERTLLVRPDLRLDAERPQQCEGAPRDCRAREVEMQRDLTAASQMHAAGDVEQAGQLGEAVTVGLRRDRRELVPELIGQGHLLGPAVPA